MQRFSDFLNELRNPKEIGQFRKSVKDIKSVDTRDNSWQYTLPDLMKKHGFSRLGSGKYASVFGNPKYSYVLKVFMKDAAYFKWLKFVQENQSNPYIPKVKGKVIKITPIFYAIRLEKLTPYKSSAPSTRKFMTDYAQWKKNPSYQSGDQNIQDILDYFTKFKSLLDLHGENMMMRNNQLVVIDPFYNWFGKKEPGKYMIDPDEVDPSIF